MSDSNITNLEFTRLWVKAQPMVTSYVFASVRKSHDAEDLVQETAAVALADIESFDAQRPFLPWVMGIARHRILDYYRRHSGEKLQFDDTVLQALAVAHEQVESEETARRHALGVCLKQLQGRRREALRLRYAEGLAVNEVAARFSATANAISLLLHKARKSLAECVERRITGGENQ